MHAYGIPPRSGVPNTGVVWIDHGRLGLAMKARLTIEEAQKLQRQLGVAIGEAAGQMKLEAPE